MCPEPLFDLRSTESKISKRRITITCIEVTKPKTEDRLGWTGVNAGQSVRPFDVKTNTPLDHATQWVQEWSEESRLEDVKRNRHYPDGWYFSVHHLSVKERQRLSLISVNKYRAD